MIAKEVISNEMTAKATIVKGRTAKAGQHIIMEDTIVKETTATTAEETTEGGTTRLPRQHLRTWNFSGSSRYRIVGVVRVCKIQ